VKKPQPEVKKLNNPFEKKPIEAVVESKPEPPKKLDNPPSVFTQASPPKPLEEKPEPKKLETIPAPLVKPTPSPVVEAKPIPTPP
jgi:hypothetical protein